MTEAEQKLLKEITTEIPGFKAKKVENKWDWEYRQVKADFAYDSLESCLIDFAKTMASLTDATLDYLDEVERCDRQETIELLSLDPL